MKRLFHTVIAIFLMGLISQGFENCFAAVCCQLQQTNCCTALKEELCSTSNSVEKQKDNSDFPSRCSFSSCDRSMPPGYPTAADQSYRQAYTQSDGVAIPIANIKWVSASAFFKTDSKNVFISVPTLLQKQALQR